MEDERRDRTLWVGNLHPRVTEDILYELFLQAGPLDDVKIPKDNTGKNKNFAFVTFTHAVSVGYTLALMEGVSLYGRKLNIQPRPNAVVDNTYIDMMNNHYAYMRSLRAQAGHYSEAQGSTYRPEANLTGRPEEPRAYVPRMTWPPKPPEWLPRPPPMSSQAPVSTRDRHFNHGRSRDFPGNSCDRSDDRFGAFDYHGRDARGYRTGKDHPGMQSRYRDAPGLDRRFEEPRSYRDFGAPRGSREEMGHRTQEYSVRKRRY